jgi:Protein of unknown function (DUF3040)
MSLAPSEQHILAGIESRLRRSDPKLAARLALFRRRADRGRGPARELLSPWRTRPSRAIRFLVIAITIIAAIVITVLAARSGRPAHGMAAAICAIPAAHRQARSACSRRAADGGAPYPGGSTTARSGGKNILIRTASGSTCRSPACQELPMTEEFRIG